MAGTGDLETENELPSCSSSFDAFFFCLSPPSQFKKYYRDGTYADCDHFQKMWETCMTMKYYEVNGKKGARWQELRDQMVSMSTKSSKDHVWKMKPLPKREEEKQ